MQYKNNGCYYNDTVYETYLRGKINIGNPQLPEIKSELLASSELT